VWDKGTARGGRGWLDQHELIACATRKKGLFPASPSRGNVVRCEASDSGDTPVELLKDLLANTSHVIGRTIADPFCRSGATLIACETLTRTCYAIESSPQLAQVALERWQTFSGRAAEKLDEDAAAMGKRGQTPASRGRKSTPPARRRP
jgi:hypothetical protein